MREYETVFITQPNLSDSQYKQLVERLNSSVDKNEGRVFYARNMGKRTLAYPISKQTKGLYTCLDYAANGPAVSEIERNLRLDENVLRYLTVVKAEEIDVEARAAEVVARGEDVSTTPEQTIDEINVRDETSEASVADEISDNVPVAAKEEV